MSNNQKYIQCFTESFGISETDTPALKYQSIPSWDSIGHMQLMSQLEDIFNIELDIDDITDFSSFNKGKEILGKYGVEL